MAQKRKLQVFISSTYTDLQEERQAAVQAILAAGHIPAGMELFAAGDKSQMNVIKRWIDESDVYMLILGGRYGSIEPESQKSYIHIEYDYAIELNKPLFAVVISEVYLNEKMKKKGTKVFEMDYPDKLREFRKLVCSRMVRFWSDPRDIKLAIMETIADFSSRPELIGWIPGSEGSIEAVAEELARLTKENASLRGQLLAFSKPSITYNGLSFEEVCRLLNSYQLSVSAFTMGIATSLEDIAKIFESPHPTLLHYVWLYSKYLSKGALTGQLSDIDKEQIEKLINLRLVVDENIERRKPIYSFTEAGNQFYLRLLLTSNQEAQDFILYVPR